MDILYYSNYCKHSQSVLQHLVKGNMTNKLNFICIDKRTKDLQNNQTYIILKMGKKYQCLQTSIVSPHFYKLKKTTM